jgi:hypothetical protein
MPNIFVEPPRRNPRKGGIKSVIGDFVSVDRLPVGAGIEWISEGCDFPKAAPGLCYVPNPITEDKVANGIERGAGPIFGLYAGVECFLGVDTDYHTRAEALLSQGEGRGVEEVLWEYGMSVGGTGPAQTSWVAAIGQADEAADTLYVGQPVIMMSRFAAAQARAAGALFGSDAWDGALWTANGTPVIASAAATDTALIVFGWPTVYASDVYTTRSMHHTTNVEMAIAERVYGIAVDCSFALHYAVTVAVSDPQNPDDPELVLTIGTEPSSPVPDGTDVTVTVHANVAPEGEVNLFYRINGGAWTDNGEMTETDPTTFVENLDGTLASPGDVFDLYAKSGLIQSPTITINVT